MSSALDEIAELISKEEPRLQKSKTSFGQGKSTKSKFKTTKASTFYKSVTSSEQRPVAEKEPKNNTQPVTVSEVSVDST